MTDLMGHGPDNYSILKARVLYADTDKMGIVYHSNYFRWFEAARGTYMRSRGLPYTETEKSGVQLPLTECGIRYHKPALYEQVIDVRVWVADISAVQVKFQYEIQYEEDVLVRGFTHHAAINTSGRPTRVPAALENALNSKETIVDPSFM